MLFKEIEECSFVEYLRFTVAFEDLQIGVYRFCIKLLAIYWMFSGYRDDWSNEICGSLGLESWHFEYFVT